MYLTRSFGSMSFMHEPLCHDPDSWLLPLEEKWQTYPLMVRQIILDGARKWMGPFLGCVFILFLKNRSYFAFCLTSPPDMQTSSHLTITCNNPSLVLTIQSLQGEIWMNFEFICLCYKRQSAYKPFPAYAFPLNSKLANKSAGPQTHQLLSSKELLCCYGS